MHILLHLKHFSGVFVISGIVGVVEGGGEREGDGGGEGWGEGGGWEGEGG